jgi:uncharacterized peroxidase-related enzyme
VSYLPQNGLTMIEEDEAPAEVAELYDTIKRDLQLPFVPNMVKALANAPGVLAAHWAINRSFEAHNILPQALTSMILFTISETSNCTYCSVANELMCRTLGINEETITALVKDLGHVSPQRIQVIIDFALKVAQDAQSLTLEDYDRVRAEGITEEELVQIIQTAAFGVYVDIMADALKVDVDSIILQALEQIR